MSDPALSHDEDAAALAEAQNRFPLRITDAVRASITDPHDPVALQYLPDSRELVIHPHERADPIGDHAHTPVKGIVHRHRDRVLFKAASVCAVNCRFCFRKTMLGTPEETLDNDEIDKAIQYISTNPEISEVILTGGDPLILSPKRLGFILGRLDQMPHIKTVRIHTRIPVAAPQRITPAYLEILDRAKPLYMVIHMNHAQEMTTPVKRTLRALHRAGIVLLSQSVLLKNVNDNVQTLETLFRTLIENRVKPYYLHHPDMVPGTGHFRVPIETGQALMRALRRNMTGIALPTYVLDIPGGFGKVPLDNTWTETRDGVSIITDHAGNRHIYS